MTRPKENSPLTRRTDSDLLTRPMDFEQLAQPTEFQRKMKKRTSQMNRTQNYHSQTRHRRKRNAIRRKNVVNTGNMTRQTHHRVAIMIRPMTVIIDASDVKRRAIGKRIQSNYAHI